MPLEVDDDDDVVVAMAVDDDDDDEGNLDDPDSDEEPTLAFVAEREDDDDDDVSATESEAVVVAQILPSSPKTKKKKQQQQQKKKPQQQQSTKSPATPKGGGTATSSKTASNTTSTKKKKKQWTKKPAATPTLNVSPQYLEAARDARQMLQETVSSLPAPLADMVVQSFGRLLIDPKRPNHNNFCTTAALYPIGFSCDRYEFSPVHGRLLKLKCSILDGRKCLPKPVDGPLFRIVWGPGVDHNNTVIEYPFDPMIHAPPLSSVPLALAEASRSTNHHHKKGNGSNDDNGDRPNVLLPDVNMRVKVKIDNNNPSSNTSSSHWIHGSITAVGEVTGKSKGKSNKHNNTLLQVPVTIRYDEGFTEELVFPDADMELLLPGADEASLDDSGNPEVTQIGGKPVSCVVATSPLEAWGKVLVQLGLMDEIMFQAALEAVGKTREEAMQIARDKVLQQMSNTSSNSNNNSAAKTPKSERGDLEGSMTAASSLAPSPMSTSSVTMSHSIQQEPMSVSPKDKEHASTPSSNVATQEEVQAEIDETDMEPPSERELYLRKRVQELMEDLQEVTEENQEAAVTLADARIQLLGPCLCNPFRLDEASKAQQLSWMATAIKKEKMRMGSTGNKKKVVSAMDLLERNDTFYNADIEALIEGLPGSEYCDSYIFQAFRGAGCGYLNRAWVHEAQLKREKVALMKLKKSKEAQEKVYQEEERIKKRKHRDDVRDQRKRQKMEEEDQKKRARIEERLSRLRVQVDERLFSEATFQREKVISSVHKALIREYGRRRRAAELVAGHAVTQEVVAPRALVRQSGVTDLVLPERLSKVYDEDTLRVWDFMSSFGDFFVERGYINKLPSLDLLQAAVDALRGATNAEISHSAAVSLLTDLAVALCKPLAATLTRTLFASLISLNPNLQKDFGVAFFNEVMAVIPTNTDEPSMTDILLPVDVMTWQEIARASLVSDALQELGHQRHEAAHIIRGYRSAGHPNSKESRRLRKIEDIWVALIRQEVESGLSREPSQAALPIRVEIPCAPLCGPDDFRFFLHVIKSSSEPSLSFIKSNLLRSLEKLGKSDDGSVVSFRNQMQEVLRSIEESVSKGDTKIVKKVKKAVLQILESTGGSASDTYASEVAAGNHSEAWWWELENAETLTVADGQRRRLVGLLNSLSVPPSEIKTLRQQRETYMEEALVLKEELSRKEAKGEDDDDDDDDDEDRDESQVSKAVVVDGDDAEKVSHVGRDNGAVPNELLSNGDAIMAEAAAAIGSQNGPVKVGKTTEYDDFCGDIPTAPDLIRRCLAVLRTLCSTGQASSFLYPVDPQSNPGYYDAVLRPMCLFTIGKQLQKAAERATALDGEAATVYVDATVATFGRNVRLLERNTLSYANAGPTVIAMASEFLKIFERLFFDWVLAPDHILPKLSDLDDDRCVQPHTSDEEATVLFCDGCEGKYNIARLDPPLARVPKGDWYCPRCVSGRWWGQVDPRLGKIVRKVDTTSPGTVASCFFQYHEGNSSKPSLLYIVKFKDGSTETWSLDDVNAALTRAGIEVPPIRCLEAVAESPGYGSGVDIGLYRDLVPVPLNPNISDSAAQISLASSVFTDALAASGTLLLTDPEEMTAPEWMRVLVLLTMKCSSSEMMQGLISKMEADAAETMTAPLEEAGKVNDVRQILPDIFEVHEPANSDVDYDHQSVPGPISVEASVMVTDGDGMDATPTVVEAKAVEVVDAMEVDDERGDSGAGAVEVEPLKATPVKIEPPTGLRGALIEKKRRIKAMEDSMSAYIIKGQLKPAVASFPIDNVSQVVDSTLASKEPGLDFSSIRCRRTQCCFCGLTDVALGAPLVRVPNQEEWNELLPHVTRNRRVTLIAHLPEATEKTSTTPVHARKTLQALRIRVDGDLFSVPDSDLAVLEDGGMFEFAPRADAAFHHELLFRDESELPLVTGSLSAHECCASAAHNGRKDQMIQLHKDKQAILIERQAGTKCGRTLELGRDSAGRSYWQFNGDQNALFVCASSSDSNKLTWFRFTGAASISSVMMALRKDSMSKELQAIYPEASEMLKNGSWTNELLKLRFPKAIAATVSAGDIDDSTNDIRSVGGHMSFNVGDSVLVKSKSKDLLWDAQVAGISVRRPDADPGQNIIDAYRVEYDGWSSRYTEWVEPGRVAAPDECFSLQDEYLEDRASCIYGLPRCLRRLVAKNFLGAKDRARGTVPLPDFAQIAQASDSKSMNASTIAAMKAAILAVEAALPLGSIDATESGQWRPKHASKWRHLVKHADAPGRLMACVIHLEDTICVDWIKEDMGHLRSTLPARWKAIAEASPSSLALRVILLDRSVMYNTVDRRRFRSRKKKP